MTLKMKLTASISAFVLIIGLMLMGVFAVNQATVNMGGSISFTATDVYAHVTGSIANDTSSPSNLDVTYSAEETTGDPTVWNDLSLAFDSQATPIEVTITVENLSQQNTLRVNLNDTLSSTIGNLEKVVKNDGGDYTNQTDITLQPNGQENDSTTFTITMSVIDKNTSLTADFDYELNLFDQYYVPTAVQVTSVSSSGATTDTCTDLAGGVAIDGSVDLSGIEFATGETTLTISMKSLSANYIKNKVSWVNTSGVTISSTSLYLPKNPSEQLTNGESKDLTITVNNTGSPTTISGLEVEFEDMGEYLLQVTDEDEVSEYTEKGYWYVEMGTYSTTTDNAEGKRESEYLRWRYFSDTTSHYEFDRNTRPTGEGYFILETYISSFNVSPSTTEGGLKLSWNNEYTYNSSHTPSYYHQQHRWTNVQANDYSTSTIRQYMNSEEDVYKYYSYSNPTYTPAGVQSNMFTDLHIDPDNDIVYERIIGRTLSDLYTNMGWNGNSSSPTFNSVTFPDLANADPGYQYQETDSDKFWLLSEYEAYNLLGDSTQDAMNLTSADRSWGDAYWLRSPYSNNAGSACIAYYVGSLDLNGRVYRNYDAARAAFKFSVDEL